MNQDLEKLYAVIDATWPAAGARDLGPWLIREGQGGGQRVSATTAKQPVTVDDIPLAEAAMQELGQPRLFQIRQGQDDLDAMLADRGYAVVDPVNVWIAPVDDIATEFPPPVTAFSVWDPLAIQIDIWAKGGIGPGRIAVMYRAADPKTSLLGRLKDSPAGTAFVAIHDGIAMLHALEVLPHQRKQGMARWFMRLAAFWARDNGASHISVVCTQENAAANALYQSLGMSRCGQYHYRKHQGDMS
ncbi:putative acetyltransferase [Thalassovita gelatinovora]|uniref:Putative acetyltransferase n=1 Tax=Thalassovita gelatinovora TaxID=53501 RepID=A0A0P1F5M0_THAGE|nr:GNAT family N-acetyltransferase [Thalassovita gelatinovora]QIZ80776.1 GNAT family N-acetyltransferase [Thalassovita gelatinovora]CUH63148.1 putative acetyltransferase [Thalassovita gelatinovora]SEQ62553.1 Acetyltransferase (GNAT) family protein [Thalassovita gelatinovora]